MTAPSVPLPRCSRASLQKLDLEVEIKSMEKMEWYASYMEPTGWDITAMTAGFFTMQCHNAGSLQ